MALKSAYNYVRENIDSNFDKYVADNDAIYFRTGVMPVFYSGYRAIQIEGNVDIR